MCHDDDKNGKCLRDHERTSLDLIFVVCLFSEAIIIRDRDFVTFYCGSTVGDGREI